MLVMLPLHIGSPAAYHGGPMSEDRHEPAPKSLHLDRQRGLHVTFHDGTTAFLSLALLRGQSPSAEARHEREAAARNPLHVLSPRAAQAGPLAAEGAELVGHYAIRIRFNDGHDTGLYGWRLLRELADRAPGDGPGANRDHH
jgi:DUF971 family protein